MHIVSLFHAMLSPQSGLQAWYCRHLCSSTQWASCRQLPVHPTAEAEVKAATAVKTREIAAP